MRRTRIPSFRGLHALIAHTIGADRSLLQSQLERLGLRVTTADEADGSLAADVDLFFFDADRIGSGADVGGEWHPPAIPTVALIGSEAPGRLEALLERQPCAYLTKPIRRTGIYSCLAIAMHQYAMLNQLRRRLQLAEERVRFRRKVISAVVKVMHQGQVSEDVAYRLLQRAAMAHRISIETLSVQIVSSQRAVADLMDKVSDERWPAAAGAARPLP